MVGVVLFVLGFFEGEGCSSSEISSTITGALVACSLDGPPKSEKPFVVGAEGSGDFKRILRLGAASGLGTCCFCFSRSGGGRARLAPWTTISSYSQMSKVRPHTLGTVASIIFLGLISACLSSCFCSTFCSVAGTGGATLAASCFAAFLVLDRFLTGFFVGLMGAGYIASYGFVNTGFFGGVASLIRSTMTFAARVGFDAGGEGSPWLQVWRSGEGTAGAVGFTPVVRIRGVVGGGASKPLGLPLDVEA